MKAQTESLEELVWQLRRAFRELTVAADRELQPLGIQVGDRAFLEFLARETGPISLSDLAKKHSLSRQHIHQTLRRLPHAEWVEEIPDPADHRAVLLRLSREGWKFWERLRNVDRAFLNRLVVGLSEENVTAAKDLLTQLRHELSHIAKEVADGQS